MAVTRGLRWVIKKLSNMRNKLFYSLSVNILLVMLVVGLFVKGNFYLAVGLTVGSLIGLIMVALMFIYDNSDIIFKTIRSWLKRME